MFNLTHSAKQWIVTTGSNNETDEQVVMNVVCFELSVMSRSVYNGNQIFKQGCWVQWITLNVMQVCKLSSVVTFFSSRFIVPTVERLNIFC